MKQDSNTRSMAVPCLVQYQGSKRKIASIIAGYFPTFTGRFIEPFCGVCSMSLYLAANGFKGNFILNDINEPLIEMLKLCVDDPDKLASEYEKIWNSQFETDPISYFYEQRSLFNETHDPALMLFMLSRITKGSLRYDSSGNMNQGCDNRRFGTLPQTIRQRCNDISRLLQQRSELICGDYRACLAGVEPTDFIYFDPPYIGTTFGKDKRYINGIDPVLLVNELRKLTEKGISYAISFDGRCGDKEYGFVLPIDELELEVYEINAGRSPQATILGRNEETVERLYVHINKDIYK